MKDIADFLKNNVGKFILFSWFIFILMCLGGLKVVHMVITGQIDYPSITDPMKFIGEQHKKIMQEYIIPMCESCCECCSRYSLCIFSTTFATVTMQKEHTAQARDTRKGWRRPRQCDGMCSGAKHARRAHRKQMRINKRKGMKNETAWYQKPYTCTCNVR